jgi:hypothetical protein
MRILRITEARWKQLTQAQGTSMRGGVMVIPKIMTPDEFDAIAPDMQQRLIQEAREIAPAPPAVDDHKPKRHRQVRQ